MLGHVTTVAEKNRLLYNLGDLKFIKNIDSNSIIIDEGVLNEINSLLSSNSEWKSIRVYSPEPGQFILSGELKTHKQAEQLSSYLSLNFPYLDLLKKQIVVEEDIAHHIQAWLQNDQLTDVHVNMTNGEVILTGSFPNEKANNLSEVLKKVKQIPGVRVVSNQTHLQTAEAEIIDISDHYPVTGKSRLDNKYTVVINGRILSEGGDLDGMTITNITSNHIDLEKGRDKYRINY
jgi:type III secretion system YscD/HrpQ family protein